MNSNFTGYVNPNLNVWDSPIHVSAIPQRQTAHAAGVISNPMYSGVFQQQQSNPMSPFMLGVPTGNQQQGTQSPMIPFTPLITGMNDGNNTGSFIQGMTAYTFCIVGPNGQFIPLVTPNGSFIQSSEDANMPSLRPESTPEYMTPLPPTKNQQNVQQQRQQTGRYLQPQRNIYDNRNRINSIPTRFRSTYQRYRSHKKVSKPGNQIRHQETYRSKQNKIDSVYQRLIIRYGEQGQDIVVPKTQVLRGPDVLRVHVKKFDALDTIEARCDQLENDSFYEIQKVSIPLSMKNQFQKKGFLLYLKFGSPEQAEQALKFFKGYVPFAKGKIVSLCVQIAIPKNPSTTTDQLTTTNANLKIQKESTRDSKTVIIEKQKTEKTHTNTGSNYDQNKAKTVNIDVKNIYVDPFSDFDGAPKIEPTSFRKRSSVASDIAG